MRRLLRFRLASGSLLVSALACTQPPSAEAESAGQEAAGSESESESETGPDDWGALDESESESETGDDAPPVGPEIVDYETCIVDPGAPTADLIGDSPIGAFNGQYAWFGWLTCSGKAISPTLVVGESPQDLANALAIAPSSGAVPKPSIEWFLLGHCNPAEGWTGEGAGGVVLRSDGPWEIGYGYFAITSNYKLLDPVDPEDPPTISGALLLDEDGWGIDGEFTAVYCGALSYALEGC
jgi:hypothetical protein